MTEVTTIGLDIAKNVFQAHGIDGSGRVTLRRRLRRAELLDVFARLPRCLIGMEACATAHHWARELARLGHEVRLMAPSYVKPYVKRQKNDSNDAAAICEAVTRPSMRFVGVKGEEQQSVLILHRTRELLVRQRTMLINALRAHLAEFGVVERQGRAGVAALMAMLEDPDGELIPPMARMALLGLVSQLKQAGARIAETENAIHAWHRADDTSRRLATIPGIGPITASALAASVSDPSAFVSGRHMAAWIGLVPRQNSSGGKARLGGITKQGDRYLRRLLVVGAHAVLRFARRAETGPARWAADLAARKPFRVAAVALANKMARIAWAVMIRGETFRMPAQPQAASA